jgi:hypothetical protein
MKKVLPLLLLASCLLSASLQAQKASWTSLFDGKTLKGWNQKNGAANYSVENGQNRRHNRRQYPQLIFVYQPGNSAILSSNSTSKSTTK